MLIKRYGKYLDIIEKLMKYPFDKIPTTIKELEIPSGLYQSAFKEMKEMNFDGAIVDYLCFITTENVLRYWAGLAEGYPKTNKR